LFNERIDQNVAENCDILTNEIFNLSGSWSFLRLFSTLEQIKTDRRTLLKNSEFNV